MRSYIDNIFDYLAGDSMWNEEDSGDVEAPTGHFALVEIPEHKAEREDMFREIDNLTGNYVEDYPDEDTYIKPGWYIITTTGHGHIMPARYESEDAAREEFEELDQQYSIWLDQDVDQYPHDEHIGLDLPTYGE